MTTYLFFSMLGWGFLAWYWIADSAANMLLKVFAFIMFAAAGLMWLARVAPEIILAVQ